MVDGGRVTVQEEGTTVGPYSTAVRAANVRSIGLGGDSLIGLDSENRLTVGPARVVPISHLAHTDRRVARDLRTLNHRIRQRPTPDHLEYWFLQREPRRFGPSDRGRRVLNMLRQQPLSLSVVLERMGLLLHPLQFAGQTLIEREIIGRAALTPTDLLHLTGEYAPWDAEAAGIAAKLMARLVGCTVDELIRRIKTTIVERITAEVISFLSGQTLNRAPDYVVPDDLGLWLFEESLYKRHPYLDSQISLKIPIIGIGAPAGIFLPRVAGLLGTDLILPPHYQVANAIGAVAGSVMLSREGWILPRMRGMDVVGYYAQTGQERRRFPTIEEALAYARQAIAEEVLAEVQAAGGIEPHLEFEQLPDGAERYLLRASAIANPRLGG